MIVDALDNLGGVEYLETTARSHPAAFLSLLGKVMPVQVEGAGGGPVQVERTVRFVKADPKPDEQR
jgi:hypothetical protein